MSITSIAAAPVRASAADPLGYDVKLGADLDAGGRSATGLELVMDALLHRLQQETLELTGAPDDEVPFGVNARAWVGEALSEEGLQAKAPQVEEALRRDPRIADVRVELTRTAGPTAALWSFTIAIHAVTRTGETIDRIVGVSSVSVAYLAEGR